jgi:hypothetical protein
MHADGLKFSDPPIPHLGIKKFQPMSMHTERQRSNVCIEIALMTPIPPLKNSNRLEKFRLNGKRKAHPPMKESGHEVGRDVLLRSVRAVHGCSPAEPLSSLKVG